MSEGQTFAWLLFVVVAMFSGYLCGFFIGYDRAMDIKHKDPQYQDWYRWPRLKVNLYDHLGDYKQAREITDWLKENVSRHDFHVYVHDDAAGAFVPHAMFYVKDRNIALTLSIRYNITYFRGY